MRTWLLMVLLLSGCATVRIENWQLRTDECKTKVKNDEVVCQCRWHHRGLGS